MYFLYIYKYELEKFPALGFEPTTLRLLSYAHMHSATLSVLFIISLFELNGFHVTVLMNVLWIKTAINDTIENQSINYAILRASRIQILTKLMYGHDIHVKSPGIAENRVTL